MDFALPRLVLYVAVAAVELKWARHAGGLLEKPVGVAAVASETSALQRSAAEESWDSQTLP